jgi:hypothetical protein
MRTENRRPQQQLRLLLRLLVLAILSACLDCLALPCRRVLAGLIVRRRRFGPLNAHDCRHALSPARVGLAHRLDVSLCLGEIGSIIDSISVRVELGSFA